MSGLDKLGEAASADASSRKGIGFAALLDGVIVLVVAIVCLCLNRAYSGMSSGASFAIMMGITILLLITGICMVKEMKAGDILGWVSAIFTLVWGIVTTFSIKGDMIFYIYFLLTGLFMLIYMAQMTVKENKH